jgi:hypothetical protein
MKLKFNHGREELYALGRRGGVGGVIEGVETEAEGVRGQSINQNAKPAMSKT